MAAEGDDTLRPDGPDGATDIARPTDTDSVTRPGTATSSAACDMESLEMLKQLIVEASVDAEEPLPEADHLLEHERRAARAKALQANMARERSQKRDLVYKEKWWADMVRERKASDRRRAAEEAEAAARAARLAASPPETPRARQRKAEIRAQAETEAADKETWLQAEWEPLLARRREQARAQRADEERAAAEAAALARSLAEREKEEREHQEAARLREVQGMAAEDAASTAFVATADAECERRSAVPVDGATAAAVAQVLANPSRELWWQLQDAERSFEAAARQRALQQQREESDYREWREQVRSARLRERRLEGRRWETHRDAEAKRSLELQGRDFWREQEIQHEELLRATEAAARERAAGLQQAGCSPRGLLQEARSLAERQRAERERDLPRRLEQEQWESLLAKTRLARQGPVGTPRAQKQRWGLLGAA